jgi:hypothetical protein
MVQLRPSPAIEQVAKLVASTGKQWKTTKTQFRPGMKSARPTFEERQAERVAMAAMKAREKELKDEKVQKKKVLLPHYSSPSFTMLWCADGDAFFSFLFFLGASTGPEREARAGRGEGAVREAGGADASEEGGSVEAAGEAEQGAQGAVVFSFFCAEKSTHDCLLHFVGCWL